MWMRRRRRMHIGKPKLRVRFFLGFVALGLMLSVIQVFYYVEFTLRPTFIQLAETVTKQKAIDAINKTLNQSVQEQANYTNMLDLIKDNNGRVIAAQPNMAEINQIKVHTADEVQKTVEKLQSQTISLPLGLALNSTVLAMLGPSIPIKIEPIGIAKTSVQWEYNTVGINQTIHVIYLTVKVQMNVFVPFVTKTIETETRLPITYWVLTGDVPQFFYDAHGTPYTPNGLSPYITPPPAIAPPVGAPANKINLP